MPILSPAQRSLLVFNFLPSRTLHPSRFSDYGAGPYIAALAAMPEFASIWHRRWSGQILRQEGLQHAPVTDLAATGLAVAILRDGALTSLIRRLGIVLCAPRLRGAISGGTVRALQAALGKGVLQWIKEAPAMHPGLPGAGFPDADEALRHVDLAGRAALSTAFQAAPACVARRLLLKLPPWPISGTQEGGDPDAFHGGGAEAIVHAVTASMDGETAMSLVTTVHDGMDFGGQDGISC